MGWFNNESVFALAATGEYKGVEGISEYVAFASTASPLFSARTTTDGPTSVGGGVEGRECFLSSVQVDRYTMGAVGFEGATYSRAILQKLFFDYDTKIISRISLHYQTSYH